jgi:hypothetical protein
MVHNQHMNKDEIDFLGIGLPRSGTTWLWNVLRHHPDVWMPPRKELHYFDRSLKYAPSSFMAGDTFLKRLIGKQVENQAFRRIFIGSLFKTFLLPINWRNIRWTLHFLLGTMDDHWYISLFKTKGEKVKGEITPAYCILDSTDVQHVEELFPDLKLILLLRNPVERSWSGLRLNWKLGKFRDMDKPEKVIAEAERLCKSPYADYLRAIKTWKSFFPENNLLIGFYDDIILHPQELTKRIFEFLEINTSINLPEKLLSRKFYGAKYAVMPIEVAKIFAQNYLPYIEELSTWYPGYPSKWLTDIHNILMQN